MANPTSSVRSSNGKSGVAVVSEPLEHLIQHIKQDDPKLYEALKRIASMIVAQGAEIREGSKRQDEIESKPPAKPPDFAPPDVDVTNFVVGGRIVSHYTAAAFSGKIIFPVDDLDYAEYLHHVEAEFEWPNGERIVIRRWGKPDGLPPVTDFVDVWDDRILLGEESVPNCKMTFYAVGPDGTYGPDPKIIVCELPAIGLTSVVGEELISDRWQDDPDRNVHSVVTGVIERVADVPFYVTAWTEHPEGSVMPPLLWHGWFPVDDIVIGAEGSNTNLFSPLRDETWSIIIEIGTIDSWVPPSDRAFRSVIKRK